jgi:small ligand-binding sensory domain FIST
MQSFLSATSIEKDWQSAADDLLQQLGAIPAEANVAFIYATDAFATELSRLLDELKTRTAIYNWVGSIGKGICTNKQEIYDQAAVTVMLADFPENSFTVFSGMENAPTFETAADDFSSGIKLAVIHGDPRNGMVTEHIQQLPEKISQSYSIGGITSSDNHFFQVADTITEGDISGIVFDEQTQVISGLTQGCTPIGNQHTLTSCSHHLAMTIDKRPALDVFKEEIGDILARNIDRAAGYIFAGFPIRGRDTSDYRVRDIIGIDEENDYIAIADNMEEDSAIMFCKRDGQSAIDDMQHMLTNIKKRLGDKKVRGALYITCLGRGKNLFGNNSEELGMINAALGDIPLAGFYANGEIAGDQLYGYTGVLTVFI